MITLRNVAWNTSRLEDQVRRDAAPVHGIMSADRVGQSSLRNFRILQ
jgi:hypothetical protein